jgi:3',5'-cyclic AMP phosphodiesterase CpdA
MLIAHLSDCHVVPDPKKCYGMVDTPHWLAQSIARLNAMSPRPDLVVLSGDLVDEPSDEAYATLTDLLAALTLPFVVIPGNHDDLGLLRRQLPEHGYLRGAGDKAHFSIDLGPVRLIAFDAVVPGKEWALVTTHDLDWLAAELASASDRPTMLVMHHPPIVTGIAFMDALQPVLHPGFEALLDRHPQVRLIACGHVHRVVDGMLGHARVAVAGSTAHQFRLAIDTNMPPAVSLEPPSIRLHYWRGADVTSFLVPVAEAPWQLFPGVDEASWPSILHRMREGASRAAVYPDELKAHR